MTSSDSPATADAGRVSLVRNLALAVGVIYTVVGLVGFVVTGFGDFADETGKTLFGFEINPLHNIVHLLIGLVGIAMSRTLRNARTYGWVLAAAYGLVFVYGLFAADDADVDVLSLNWADNWLHLVTVLVGLVIALLPVRRGATTARGDL